MNINNYYKFIGQKFNKLTILKFIEEEIKSPSSQKVLCKCDCGNEKTTYFYNIKRGQTKSCGCIKKENGYASNSKKEEEYIGLKFNKLTILKFEDHESKIKSQRKVSCKCDCGNQIISRLNCVMGGQRQSCGCVKNKNRIKNIIKRNEKYKGKKYGKLLILKYVEDKKTKHSNSYYLCKCDCGNEKIIELRSMKSGRVKSCGCIQKERIRKIGKESKLPFGESPFNSLYIRYVKSAENRHLSFLLTKDQFKNIVIKNCYYCNCSPEIYTRNRYYKDTDYFIHNGIDRINSEKGYEMDNCVPCCSFCNYSKSDYEEKYFLDKIVKIYNHKIKNEISNNTKNSFN